MTDYNENVEFAKHIVYECVKVAPTVGLVVNGYKLVKKVPHVGATLCDIENSVIKLIPKNDENIARYRQSNKYKLTKEFFEGFSKGISMVRIFNVFDNLQEILDSAPN